MKLNVDVQVSVSCTMAPSCARALSLNQGGIVAKGQNDYLVTGKGPMTGN